MKYIVHKHNLTETIQAYNDIANVFFPVKSNANKKLLLLIDPYVCGYEVESLYHARLLVENLKVSPDRILFSYQTISLDNTSKLLSLQITHFVVDDVLRCQYLIDKADELGVKLSIMLRLDVLEAIRTQLIVKWGASFADLVFMKSLIKKRNHCFEGISYYLPQEINNIKNSLSIVEYIIEQFGDKSLKTLNVGGGITPTNLDIIKKAIEAKCNNPIKIYVEPGRPLLNPNIDLIVKVINIRKKNNQTLLFIDSGIYSGLIDCIIKGRSFEIRPVNNTEKLESYLICGNSSDISDVIGTYRLPFDIKIGDELIIQNCGAYCSEMNMDFCKDKRANYIIS